MIRRGLRGANRVALPLLLAGIAVAESGLPGDQLARGGSLALAAVLTVVFVRESLRRLRLGGRLASLLRLRLLELTLTAAALALLLSKAFVWVRELLTPGSVEAMEALYRQYAVLFLLVAGARVLAGDFPVRRILSRLELRPAQTVAVGFAAASLGGALLLSLPLSVTRLTELSLLDALFTAVSAVTVTGLVVHDPRHLLHGVRPGRAPRADPAGRGGDHGGQREPRRAGRPPAAALPRGGPAGDDGPGDARPRPEPPRRDHRHHRRGGGARRRRPLPPLAGARRGRRPGVRRPVPRGLGLLQRRLLDAAGEPAAVPGRRVDEPGLRAADRAGRARIPGPARAPGGGAGPSPRAWRRCGPR
jgi:hypothetical protein